MQIIRKIDEFLEEYIMGVLLVCISLVMLAQIIMRISGSSLAWAEEVCRYFYLWSVFLSVPYTINKRIILKVDVILEHLSPGKKRILEILLGVVNALFFAYLSYFSILTIKGIKASQQSSPAMELPMYLVYLILPIGFTLAVLRSIQQIYAIYTYKQEKLSS